MEPVTLAWANCEAAFTVPILQLRLIYLIKFRFSSVILQKYLASFLISTHNLCSPEATNVMPPDTFKVVTLLSTIHMHAKI